MFALFTSLDRLFARSLSEKVQGLQRLQSGQLYQLVASTLQLASSFFLHLSYLIEFTFFS